MACDLPTTELAACASGIGKQDNPIRLLQLIAQLSCELASAASGNEPGGPNMAVQFNDGGVFGGDADFTWDKTTNTLSFFNMPRIHVYDTFVSGANFRRMTISDAAGGGGLITLEGAGASAIGNVFISNTIATGGVIFGSGGTASRWTFISSGHLYTFTDNVYDIGDLAAASRPRSGYFGTGVSAPILRTDTGFTVGGTLPAAGTAGRRAYVTNALAPAFGAAVAGGGAVVIPVFDDGTNWIVG